MTRAPQLLDKVAVIAVHGVADQKRGATVEAVAALLASEDQAELRRSDRVLDVPPLAPLEDHRQWSPHVPAARIRRSFGQSRRSDFVAEIASRASATFDLGARLTDYLLFKSQEQGRASERAQVATVAVRSDEIAADLFELHWADLSRVQSGFARVLSELITMLFRFARLSTEAQTLAAARARSRVFGALSRAHQLCEWWFSRLLGPAACQLIVCLGVLLGALAIERHVDQAVRASSALLGLAVACGVVYRAGVVWRFATPLGFALALGTWVGLRALPRADQVSAMMLSWTALVSVLYVQLAWFWERRFKATFGPSMLLWVATLGVMSWFAHDFDGPWRWHRAAIAGVEAVLVLNMVLWMVAGVLLAATVVLFECVVARGAARDPAVRKVMVTARLGLFTSVGAFLIAFMVGLAVTDTVLSAELRDVPYSPWYFIEPVAEAVGAPNAADFLHARARGSAASFAPVALLLLTLVGVVFTVFAPSVFRELRVLRGLDARRFGRWLTSGYLALERLVRWWGIPTGAVSLLIVAAMIVRQRDRWVPERLEGTIFELAAWVQARTVEVSDAWLSTVVTAIAGSAVGLFALGKVAVRQLKALRMPLDAALDVDNHFREFPRHAISRVMILERYVALLDHLQRCGYQRLVIVAHSQGSVITADALRYLRQRAGARRGDRMEQIAGWLASADLRLLTLGSPLRQLYALRFPNTYAWAIAPVEPGWTGPSPNELAAKQWWNLWASGDYVGRWLWASEREAGSFAIEVDAPRYSGRMHEGRDAEQGAWLDRCVGADAHTHYFDLDQRVVAAHLHALVRGASPPP